MARHGENIRKRTDGRWEGRYPVYNAKKGRNIYRSIYGSTYEEVRVKLAVYRNRNTKGSEVEEKGKHGISEMVSAFSKIRFGDIAEKWLTEVQRTKKPSTYVKYNLIYRNHLKTIFHDAYLSEITEALVSEKISDHLTDSIRKSVYCVLNQILKFASQAYAFVAPELKRSPVLFSDSKKKSIKVLSRKEQEKLFATLHKEMDQFKIAVALCLYTGLRLGELCALKWTDIDFQNRLLTVNRTVQRLYTDGYRTKTILVETAPKSESSRREIPLSNEILELFSLFQDRIGYVFGGSKPMEPRTMQNHFKKILKEANLDNRNFHTLRHTFATNCAEGGTDVKSLSEILGHSDVQITLSRYVHPSLEAKRRYLDTLASFYGQIYGQAG